MFDKTSAIPHYELCVLIPYYNNPGGLAKSVRSIQYPGKFIILIVDDGSTESFVPESISEVASGPVHVIRMHQNSGITRALNRGLAAIGNIFRCDFVARLDCGDLCMPDRFTKQLAVLRQDETILLTGTWCIFKNFETKAFYQYKTPADHRAIMKAMNFRNVFIHPTILWRYDELVRYPESFPQAEDYALCYEMGRKGKVHIIPESLVTCEINPKGLSWTNRKQQLKSRAAVVRYYSAFPLLEFLGIWKLRLLSLIPYRWILRYKTGKNTA